MAIAATPTSVYESFIHNDDEEEEIPDTPMVDVDSNDPGAREQQISSEVEAHEKRWRRFLLQVWEEEKITS